MKSTKQRNDVEKESMANVIGQTAKTAFILPTRDVVTISSNQFNFARIVVHLLPSYYEFTTTQRYLKCV